jgi:hypothetical protein
MKAAHLVPIDHQGAKMHHVDPRQRHQFRASPDRPRKDVANLVNTRGHTANLPDSATKQVGWSATSRLLTGAHFPASSTAAVARCSGLFDAISSTSPSPTEPLVFVLPCRSGLVKELSPFSIPFRWPLDGRHDEVQDFQVIDAERAEVGDLPSYRLTVRSGGYRPEVSGPKPGFPGGQHAIRGRLLHIASQQDAGSPRGEPLARTRRLDDRSHSPSEFRCNGVLRNLTEFYDAFGVKEGDKLWLAPSESVRIW